MILMSISSSWSYPMMRRWLCRDLQMRRSDACHRYAKILFCGFRGKLASLITDMFQVQPHPESYATKGRKRLARMSGNGCAESSGIRRSGARHSFPPVSFSSLKSSK